ncbi:TusA-related sulfurtransferase/rhodanese-related sulfurtransferase [Bacillus ectoiniformans]|uniref:sulfurtransferase TusA family protein n=1 Tax=Bacillus ectoiniformans TaxID=1494429 RepID=UPI00195A3AD0|nr:sulfurtransferase TusA family protein [Bacillus ectoiniformans]MBM7649901.1 TusA-related sulfurtransferase/rhodanese-related sulfurtransferase [Bacillus ectoiniformans]
MNADVTVDAKGLACPMPIVKTKNAIKNMNAGETLELITTDKGSVADIPAWAKSTGHEYLSLVEEGDLFIHYVKKAEPKENVETDVVSISNEELISKLGSEPMLVLDVREPEEYAAGHVPGAYSVPLSQVEGYLNAIPQDQTIYVMCKSGMRSQMACDTMWMKGHTNIIRVVPGMGDWNGPVEKQFTPKS